MDAAWVEQVEAVVDGIFQQARPGHRAELARARAALDDFVRSLGDVPLGHAAAMGRWAALGGDVVEVVPSLTPERVVAVAGETRPDAGVVRFGRKGLLVLADSHLGALERFAETVGAPGPLPAGAALPAAALVAVCAVGVMWERSVLDLPT